MQYKFLKKPKFKCRIRVARKKTDQDQEQQLPDFILYRKNRKHSNQKDFQYQYYQRANSIQSSRNQRNYTSSGSQYSRPRNLRQSIYQQNKQIKKNLVELKQLIIQLNNKPSLYQSRVRDLRLSRNQEIDQSLIEKKIMELIPKYTPQAYSHTLNTNSLRNYQLPPIQQNRNHQNQNSKSNPIQDERAKLKRKKAVRKRLRKMIIVVSFPFLLRKYSQKLIKIRRDYYQNNRQQKKQTCIQLLTEWQMHIIQNAMSIMIKKKELEIDFIEQKNPKVQIEKIKLTIKFINLITKQLLQSSEPDILQQFADYIQLTCLRGSFLQQKFFLKKQLNNLYYSQKHQILHASKGIEEVQIILFIFIKGFIYKNILNYKRLPENQTKAILKRNLLIIASILYHCCCEIMQSRLNQKQKKYIIRGNFNEKVKTKVILHETTKQQNQYISGLIKKDKLKPLITWQDGNFWKSTKQNIQRVLFKIYILVNNQHKIMNQHYKELELKT